MIYDTVPASTNYVWSIMQLSTTGLPALPLALQSHYNIDIYDGAISVLDTRSFDIHFNDNVVNVNGDLSVDMQRGCQVVFNATTSNTAILLAFNHSSQCSIEFQSQNTPTKIIIIDAEATSKKPEIEVGGCLNGEILFSQNLPLTSAKILISNFVDYCGEWISYGNGFYDGRARLRAEGWLITIDKTSDVKERLKFLRKKKSYAVTHIAKIEREDGNNFSESDLADLRQCLYYFLSFCKGNKVGVLLSSGFDSNGSEIYKAISNTQVDYWESIPNWFPGKSNCLSELFPKFKSVWDDSNLNEALRYAISWYNQSNQRSSNFLETSIVLQQIAFELLEHTVLVEQRKIISQDGYEKILEKDRLRILLHEAKLDFNIPTSLPTLVSITKSLEPKVGPDLLAYLRNRIVHPNSKNRRTLNTITGNKEYEAWKLGKFYLEKVLLNFIGYVGEDNCKV
jgi:hypothetical protein